MLIKLLRQNLSAIAGLFVGCILIIAIIGMNMHYPTKTYMHTVPTDSKYYNVHIDPSNGDIYFNPKVKHEYTVILLHGLGGDPSFYFDFFTEDVAAPLLKARLVFPYS